ncbi:nucleotidyl transferase AbiEii/AbiGii toxin family protein [Myroides sp. LJL115]
MVDKRIVKTIKELQSLSSLQLFFLAGGTNLALRFNHRESEDIDLFCQEKIGIKGFKLIETEIKNYFKDRVVFTQISSEDNDDIVFLRTVIKTEGLDIKIDVIQSHSLLNEIENINTIRMASIEDIAVFKITTICNRKAIKDLFDLDFITDKVLNLEKIINLYSEKKIKDNRVTIFNYKKTNCPLENPEFLLGITSNIGVKTPYHGNPNTIKGVEKSSVLFSRSSWKIKVNSYIKSIKNY